MNNKLYSKRNIIILVIGVVLAIIAIIAFNNINNLKEDKIEANNYFYTSKYDEAIDKYKSIGKRENQSLLWDAKISEVYLLKKDIENANKYMEEAIKKEDKTGDAQSIILNNKFNIIKDKLAEEKIEKKDFEIIEKYGEELLKKYSSNKQINKTMFLIYMSNNNYDKAKSIVDNYPVSEGSAYDLAEKSRMYMILNKTEEGLSTLKAAYDLDKNEIKIYDVIYESYEENKTLLNNIIKLSEKNKEDLCYKLWLAKIYSIEESKNKGKEIINDIINEVKDSKDFLIVRLLEISILDNNKEYDKAEEKLNILLTDYPKDYRVNNIAAWHYFNKKNFDMALKYGEKSLKADPSYIDNYVSLMPNILKAIGEPDSSEPYFHYAAYKEPYNSSIYISKATYDWYSNNDSISAVKNFKVAQILKPNITDFKYQTALIYLSNHNYNEAINILKTCVEEDDKSIKYHRTLGTAYLISKNTKEALNEIKISYSLDQKDILTLNNAGCYYITVDGDLERAFENLDAAYKGLKDSDDDYTRTTIKENYNKIVDLKNKYANGKDNEVLQIPDFVMFY
ncbi:tetratricopeptide repeat protein [Clostridium sp. Marseille-QA1073]